MKEQLADPAATFGYNNHIRGELDRRVTLLVNSSDGFQDCWMIFFDFLERYWPGVTFPILLNTEQKNWSHPRLPVRCTQVAVGESRRLSWSECLMRALDQVETPLVLYLQEDYFIDNVVRADVVKRAIDLMMLNPGISHVALTKHASHPPYLVSDYRGFLKIRQKARYRVATQAALWRPAALKSYLHPSENGWMFEILGTRRARHRPDDFLIADFTPGNGGPAIDYIHTGIIKGRWHPAVPSLFARHGMAIDTARRGLYVRPGPFRRRMELINKLISNPGHLLSQIFLKQSVGR